MADEPIIINTLEPGDNYRNQRINRFHEFQPVPVEHEPKFENRFIVCFPERFQMESFVVQKINRPSISLSPSGYEWNNIEIEFLDLIGPSTTKRIYDIIKFCKREKKKKKWLFFKRKENILFSIHLISLDPCGIEIERWVIEVKDVLSANFGEFDYTSDELQKCSITLKPFNCTLID